MGAVDISAVKLGAVDITAVMLGGENLWSGSMGDSFNRPNSVGLGPSWVDHGPAASPFLASVFNQTCRINLPSTATVQTSQMRYGFAQSAADDGWIEIRPTTEGARGVWATYAMRRLTNAAFTDGVGIEVSGGHLRITRLLGSTYAVQEDCGAFMPGDVIRLTQLGNLHTLTLNGKDAGHWDDYTASAHSGAGYLSAGVAVMGEIDAAASAQYSPALDYVRFS